MTYIESAVDALRAGGVAVNEFPGWRERFHTDGPFDPRGMFFHHDASQFGPSPSVKDWMWVNGEYSPACHFWVDYDGNWWVGCNGRAWHAGLGGGWGVFPANDANSCAIGVETDHTVGESWPQAQYDSIVKGFALICRKFGWNPNNSVCGHKEYAPDRKIDPAGVDLNKFRSQVANWKAATKGWDEVATKAEVAAAVNDVVDTKVRAVIEERLPALLKDAFRQWGTRAALAAVVEGRADGNLLFTPSAHEDPKVVASVAPALLAALAKAKGHTNADVQSAVLSLSQDLAAQLGDLTTKINALVAKGTV